ncbi:succinate dehydrogenase cytochrome b subunit [Trichloromonas sp.]|uniref:succinate dehydrogenase cytochrome b subunit n=1 Tax=Trichloromonas sp. TaxID=3069249 RepID=UPI003D81731A
MQFIQSTVGRKIIMAVTGLILISFICVHLLGNSSVFFGADGINAYAKHLHDLGPLVWVFRLIMLAVFGIHIIFGIQLTLENRAATPGSYAVKKMARANFASETMIVSGLLLLVFVAYHILHFTMHVTNPEISASHLPVDALNRPDVFSMVVLSFQKFIISLIYVAAMVFLFLHVSHGFQSFIQTFGFNNGSSLPVVEKVSKGVALVLLFGYISIPILIIAGIVKI